MKLKSKFLIQKSGEQKFLSVYHQLNGLKMVEKKLQNEANAFNLRILKRKESGFIPDLRNLKKNNFFFKSFWRDPLFVKLYIGEIHKNYLSFFKKYSNKTKLLDIGCGAGYHSLELARDGFDVTALDISDESIKIAKETARKSKIPIKGKLFYETASYKEIKKFGKFDIILSSGFMHHLPNLEEFVDISYSNLEKNGILVWHEPQHKEWKKFDSSVVAILRLILSEAKLWYENDLAKNNKDFTSYAKKVHKEYFLERDPDEKEGQSPNDLSCDKDEIINEVKKKFKIIKLKPSFAFIYRFLGGLRGDPKLVNKLARLLAKIDKKLVNDGILNANYFFGVAKKK